MNQSRMWLSSHWAVRQGLDWRDGEDYFFRHLIDGSRAANRLGWQWTTGTGSAKHYGFSRQQVEKRAPGLCATCVHNESCPIQAWPSPPNLVAKESPSALRSIPDVESVYIRRAVDRTRAPDVVWLTAESLGRNDPALAAHPDLPAVFVFDEPLLRKLQLSSKRLLFLTETLAEVAQDRELSIWLGDPSIELAGRRLAVTFAPVPGFRRLGGRLQLVETHPWRWLVEPSTGSVASFSAWRKTRDPVLTG